MGTGDARHGRRDNGLVAAEYAPAGDVDPRVGEHLLDVLGLEGIAAYLRPSTDLHPVTRQSSLPARPTDRLFVDRVHLTTARDYLTRLAADAEADNAPVEADQPETVRNQGPLTGPVTGPATTADIDDAWARIVAGFAADAPSTRQPGPAADTLQPWPPAENLDEPNGPDRITRTDRADGGSSSAAIERLPRAGAARGPASTPDAEEPSLLDGLDTFGAGLPDEEEGYTPPAPPPIPRPSLPTVLGVVGVVGGLFTFLQPGLLPVAPSTAMVVGFLAIMAGFATLVWRLRPGDDDEDIDPTNGARV